MQRARTLAESRGLTRAPPRSFQLASFRQGESSEVTGAAGAMPQSLPHLIPVPNTVYSLCFL